MGDKATLKCGKTVYITKIESSTEGICESYKDSETRELIMNHWAMPRLAMHWKSLMVKYSPNGEYQYIDWTKTPHDIVT
jgi:hypothetical protein